MPDHYHVIIKPEGRYGASEIVRDFNKYTAREIIRTAFEMNDSVLGELSRCKVLRPTRQHQVWREEPWIEAVYSERFFRQKLNYIHLNPVRKCLAADPGDYWYSSFRSLVLDEHRPLKVDRMQFGRK